MPGLSAVTAPQSAVMRVSMTSGSPTLNGASLARHEASEAPMCGRISIGTQSPLARWSIGNRGPVYLGHCPLFLRASIVCKQFGAQAQPGVAHFFEHALMQALTSQLTPAARARPGATAIDSPQTNTMDRKAIKTRRDMESLQQ